MAKRMNVVGAKPKRIEIVDQPKRRIEPAELAAALGASPAGQRVSGTGDPIALAELGTQLLHRLRSSGGRPALADATVNCRVPLSVEDTRTLESMVAQIGSSTGSKPSVGQLVSVIVRLHLNELQNAPKPAVPAESTQNDIGDTSSLRVTTKEHMDYASSSSILPQMIMDFAISRSILQQMIDEQINPIREQVTRLAAELHASAARTKSMQSRE